LIDNFCKLFQVVIKTHDYSAATGIKPADTLGWSYLMQTDRSSLSFFSTFFQAKPDKEEKLIDLKYTTPEQFLRQLTNVKPEKIAELFHRNHDQLDLLMKLIVNQPDNLAAYACFALMTRNIYDLNLVYLERAMNYLAEEIKNISLVQSINYIITMLNPEFKNEIYNLLKARGDNLFYLKISGLSLRNMCLADIDLRYANLCNISFVGANLKRVDMQGSMIDNTDFCKANLTQAKFSAKYTKNIYLTRTILFNYKTVIPLEKLFEKIENWKNGNIPMGTIFFNLSRYIKHRKKGLTYEEQQSFWEKMQECHSFPYYKEVKEPMTLEEKIDHLDDIRLAIRREIARLDKRIARRNDCYMRSP
jgi:uncharacterized protein YjbI with pentapeptide repeats